MRSMSGEGCDESLMRGNPPLIRTSILLLIASTIYIDHTLCCSPCGTVLPVIHLRMRFVLLLVVFCELKARVPKRTHFNTLKFPLISKVYVYLNKKDYIAFPRVVEMKLKQ